MPTLRSLLFAPANHPRHVEKALTGAADGAILDLEDAVAVAEKPEARQAARRALDARGSSSGPLAFVRINALTTPFAYDDVRAVVGPGLDGVIV
ncbi:MAG TPA: aldolase/citrate lyase family protein, partial [Ktedonobacterales bacterium]|nr:aldolase/citrate lyase family protein [Ktedonobacterales bacterium]